VRRYVTEFIGTFFFILVIGLTVTPGHQALAPLIIGCGLMVVVYMGGHVSGAHYNPAVTLAVYLRGKLPARDVVPYMIAQILGGLVGAWFCYSLLGKSFAPAPGAEFTSTQALFVEIAFTALLALVVLNSATSAHTKGNSFYGLAIGFTIVIAVFSGGPISGGVYNPAIGIGSSVINVLKSQGDLSLIWIYLLGPFSGAALGALIFKYQESAPTEA
jgi:aquaporin Z